MKSERKINLQYWFTVEGETEKWYLEHVQRVINQVENIRYSVKINAKVCKSPKKFAKNTNPRLTPEITHLCDIESKSSEHLTKFENVLAEIKTAQKDRGINYSLGYSNYSFELWIVLHKKQLRKHLTDRSKYLTEINTAYSQEFESLSSYKEKDNFERVLASIDIDSIKHAIKNAEEIEKSNEENGDEQKIEYGMRYYVNNPSLSVHIALKKILEDCKLLNKRKRE